MRVGLLSLTGGELLRDATLPADTPELAAVSENDVRGVQRGILHQQWSFSLGRKCAAGRENKSQDNDPLFHLKSPFIEKLFLARRKDKSLAYAEPTIN